jgi:hypothetical protein
VKKITKNEVDVSRFHGAFFLKEVNSFSWNVIRGNRKQKVVEIFAPLETHESTSRNSILFNLI